MADRTASVRITGTSTDAVRAINSVGTASESAATKSMKAFDKSSQSIGNKFGTLDKKLGAFGVPFSGALGKVGNQLDAAGISAEAFGGVLGGAVAGGAVVAGAAVIKFGIDSVKAAAEGEQAQARLDVALKNVGASTSEWGGKVADAAGKMAKFGVENDQVQESVARLIPATHNVGQAIADQGAVADIAAARGISYADATNIVVKAQNQQYGSLTRLGILSKEQTKTFKDGAEAVAFLGRTYAGSASAQAGTFQGKIAALNATLHNFEEEIGKAVLPTLSEFVGGGTSIIAFADKATSSFGGLGGAFEAVNRSLLGTVTGGLSNFLPLLSDSGKKSDTAADAAKKLSEATKTVGDLANQGKKGTAEYTQAVAAQGEAQARVNNIQMALTGSTQAGITSDQEAADAANNLAAQEKEVADNLQKRFDVENAAIGGTLALNEANNQATDALADYTKAQKEASDAKGKDAEKNHALRDATDQATHAAFNAAKQAGDTAAAQFDLTSTLTGTERQTARTKVAHDREVAALQFLAGTATGPVRDALNKMIGTLKSADITVHPRIDLQGVNTVLGQLSSIRESVNVTAAALHLQIGTGRQFHAAGGGQFDPGEWGTVGEQGPELVHVLQGGGIQVFDTNRSAQMLGQTKAMPRSIRGTGGQGGGVINLHLNVDPVTGRVVHQLVQSDQTMYGPWKIKIAS